MPYIQRLATSDDQKAIASLWRSFAAERQRVDPSMRIKPDFDFERYVGYQLRKPLSFCFVLQCEQQLVGFLSVYFYDEAPPPELKAELEMLENPFIPRRVGAVLGLHVEKQHQKPQSIKLLIDAALKKAEEFKVTDIDLLVSSEQTGIQALLERRSFTKSAIQYTKHFQYIESSLPSLRSYHGNRQQIDTVASQAIPLRDPLTNKIAKDLQGKTIYLEPLQDETGKVLISSRGLPIYSLPLRDPQTQDWVFDATEKLVVCPILRNENGEVVEENGIPQFESPVYEYENGKTSLKRDESGNYCFANPQYNRYSRFT
jgi:hypothetical protein